MMLVKVLQMIASSSVCNIVPPVVWGEVVEGFPVFWVAVHVQGHEGALLQAVVDST